MQTDGASVLWCKVYCPIITAASDSIRRLSLPNLLYVVISKLRQSLSSTCIYQKSSSSRYTRLQYITTEPIDGQPHARHAADMDELEICGRGSLGARLVNRIFFPKPHGNGAVTVAVKE
jgi:hypothetical protein